MLEPKAPESVHLSHGSSNRCGRRVGGVDMNRPLMTHVDTSTRRRLIRVGRGSRSPPWRGTSSASRCSRSPQSAPAPSHSQGSARQSHRDRRVDGGALGARRRGSKAPATRAAAHRFSVRCALALPRHPVKCRSRAGLSPPPQRPRHRLDRAHRDRDVRPRDRKGRVGATIVNPVLQSESKSRWSTQSWPLQSSSDSC